MSASVSLVRRQGAHVALAEGEHELVGEAVGER